jgi:hypothetical protein
MIGHTHYSSNAILIQYISSKIDRYLLTSQRMSGCDESELHALVIFFQRACLFEHAYLSEISLVSILVSLIIIVYFQKFLN